MSDRTTFVATSKPISSPDSAGGPTLRASQDGRTTDRCGLDPVLANPSAQPASSAGSATNDTSGPSGFRSSASAALSLWLENKCRQRLPKAGSTSFSMTWKEKTTPAGRRLFQLSALAPRTAATASGMWPTPQAMDGSKGSLPPRPHDTGVSLPQRVAQTLLPTPSATSYGSNQGGAAGRTGKVRPSLETMAKHNLWPTPTARLGDKKRGMPTRMDVSSGPGHAATAQGSANLRTVVLWPTTRWNGRRGNSTAVASRSSRHRFAFGQPPHIGITGAA